jgi:hypothetical protein
VDGTLLWSRTIHADYVSIHADVSVSIHADASVSIHADMSVSIMQLLLLVANRTVKPCFTLRMFTVHFISFFASLSHILKIAAAGSCGAFFCTHHRKPVLAVHAISSSSRGSLPISRTKSECICRRFSER